MSSGDEASVSGEAAVLPTSPAHAPSDLPADSPEGATLEQLNLLGRRGYAWLETKPITGEHMFNWAVKVVNAEGVGRLLSMNSKHLGYPWVGPWPLGEDSSHNGKSLLHVLSPELLVMVAEHVLGPPCLPRAHDDESPPVVDGCDDRRFAHPMSARYSAWHFQHFLLSCEHVYRTITCYAMHLRVEAGARLCFEVSPTCPKHDPLAHTRHLERSAHSALEYTAFSIALTQGVVKPCTEDAHRHEWACMHTNLMVGFARMGFRKNALLARALERRDLALRHTHLGMHCAIQCMVHGGGAIVTAYDGTNDAWNYVHIHAADDNDRRGSALPVINLADLDESRITRYKPPAPYSWLSCLRACASTHWVVFAGLCVPDAVIARVQRGDDFDETLYKGWIAISCLHTGEVLTTFETEVGCGAMQNMWMRVGDDERSLELFALYTLPRDKYPADMWKTHSNTRIVRRTFALDAERRVVGFSEGAKLDLHLGDPSSLGRGWRYLIPGEDPNGDGTTWMRANEHGPVTVSRAIASSSSGSIVLTMTGDVLASPTVLKCVSECLTVRRIVVVDRMLKVHHVRHTTGREMLSRPVALISPSGDHVVVTNRWYSSGQQGHRSFIEIHSRRDHFIAPNVCTTKLENNGKFNLVARYEIDHARLRTRSFDVSKLCAFSPCSRFLLLFFENAQCAMLDIGECGSNSPLRFRSLCNPAPRFYGHIKRFSNLQWNSGGIWLQTTHHATPQAGTASGHHIHCTVQNLALY